MRILRALSLGTALGFVGLFVGGTLSAWLSGPAPEGACGLYILGPLAFGGMAGGMTGGIIGLAWGLSVRDSEIELRRQEFKRWQRYSDGSPLDDGRLD